MLSLTKYIRHSIFSQLGLKYVLFRIEYYCMMIKMFLIDKVCFLFINKMVQINYLNYFLNGQIGQEQIFLLINDTGINAPRTLF